MDRRRFLRTTSLAGLGLVTGPVLGLGRFRLLGQPGSEISTAAADLVLDTPVVDMLGLLTLDWKELYGWFARPERFGEPDYREVEASGVNIFHPAVETSSREPHASALRWAAGWNHLLRSHGCFVALGVGWDWRARSAQLPCF